MIAQFFTLNSKFQPCFFIWLRVLRQWWYPWLPVSELSITTSRLWFLVVRQSLWLSISCRNTKQIVLPMKWSYYLWFNDLSTVSTFSKLKCLKTLVESRRTIVCLPSTREWLLASTRPVTALCVCVCSIGGFHVTSYQLKQILQGGFYVTSYQLKQILQVIVLGTAMLVSCSHVKVQGKATKCTITFYLVHTTLPNYNRVTRISTHTHTLGWNFKSLHEENGKF